MMKMTIKHSGNPAPSPSSSPQSSTGRFKINKVLHPLVAPHYDSQQTSAAVMGTRDEHLIVL